jgi:hypothetical protein
MLAGAAAAGVAEGNQAGEGKDADAPPEITDDDLPF